MATGTKLKVLPKGHRIIETSHGNYIQKQKQRRTRYKTPKATRDRMRAAARRFYLPVLTASAVGYPTILAWRNAAGYEGIDKLGEFGGSMLAYYTGFYPKTGDFKFKRLSHGLFPLLAVMLIRRTGVFKGANQALAKAKVPLRLS